MRLFIAIDIPKNILSYVNEVQSKLKGVRLTKNFHITLNFIGELDKKKLPDLIFLLNNITFNEFELETTNLGVFPSTENIKVIWIGLKNNNNTLMELQKSIEKTLIEFDIKKDFEFHPHITLARVSRSIEFPNFNLESKLFTVKEFALYQSVLTSQGPIYKKIKKWEAN